MSSTTWTEREEGRPHLAVVIPLYRAPGQIGRVLRGIPPWVETIVVVDDASPDDSAEKARAAADHRVHLLRHEENRGVGGATLTGYRRARELGARVVVKMDADDQMDPAYLPALIHPILAGEADYTKGNRFLHSRQLGDMPLVRRLGNLGLSFLTKLASGYWSIFDPTNGYTAIHADLVPLLEEARIHRRFFFETSMLIELSLLRAVVKDVSIPARYGAERSNLSEMKALLDFPPRQLRGLARRIGVHYFLRDFGPFSLFLLAGAGLVLFGAAFGLYHWLAAFRTDRPNPLGTIMIAVLPIIIGVQFLLQALILDVQNRPPRPHHKVLPRPDRAADPLIPRPEPAAAPGAAPARRRGRAPAAGPASARPGHRG